MDKLSNEEEELARKYEKKRDEEREGVTPILGKLWEKTLRRGTRASVENRL